MPTEPLSPNELDELARCCEAAEGPDRELDVLISCAVRQMPIRYAAAFLQEWPLPFVPCQFSGSIAAPGEDGGIVCHWEAREFTASLDAALTLVPEDYSVAGFAEYDANMGDLAGKFTCSLVPRDHAHLKTFEQRVAAMGRANAETPALALCAAALKARAQAIRTLAPPGP